MSLADWCVLIAGILPVLTVAVAKLHPDYDNREPRRWAESLSGLRRRAHAAHLNGFEAFPLFAAAVLVAQMRGGAPQVVNGLAAAFVAARLAYVAAYLGDRASLRSALWIAGWGLTIAIFISPALV